MKKLSKVSLEPRLADDDVVNEHHTLDDGGTGHSPFLGVLASPPVQLRWMVENERVFLLRELNNV